MYCFPTVLHKVLKAKFTLMQHCRFSNHSLKKSVYIAYFKPLKIDLVYSIINLYCGKILLHFDQYNLLLFIYV